MSYINFYLYDNFVDDSLVVLYIYTTILLTTILSYKKESEEQ